MPSDASVRSQMPALNAAAQPKATAALFGESPASTPPAPASPTRPPTIIQRLVPASIQTVHAATDKPSVTAIAMPRASSVPGGGLARQTLMITRTRPTARMASIHRGTSTTRAPVTGSCRVA